MCKSPLFAYQYISKVCDLEGEYIIDPCSRYDKRLHFIKCNREKFDLLKQENTDPSLTYLEVPCGNCIECRLNKSREWASRIVCEQQTSTNSFFLTLTYDNDHLPFGDSVYPTCRIDDISKFFKDLRRYCEYHFGSSGELRHYSCSEYGDVTHRPHYHSCVFNLPSQLVALNVPYKASFQGDIYYNNPILNKIWGKGYVVIGELNFQSAAYVARYVVKKLKGDLAKKEYDDAGIEPPSARMSRRPGIGSKYYDLMKDNIYKYDALYLPKIGKVKPSAYFDKKFALDDPAALEVLKGGRSLSAQRRMELILSMTDVDYETYLKNEEEILENRLKKLVRPVF